MTYTVKQIDGVWAVVRSDGIIEYPPRPGKERAERLAERLAVANS